ncbi:uncharacterized protein K02A2.6-like [Copidosoma floridanum]|uniref:uncharacterized protein K02A2.6-like n=1 Tax=Copidosoma floridanum TaxID=29053 RepID=UPI0006C9422B|nr:uncharacterized protein K02A2.6-like [Copidosoma floridanum]
MLTEQQKQWDAAGNLMNLASTQRNAIAPVVYGTWGSIGEFSEDDDWSEWYERFEQYVLVNEVPETKQLVWGLSDDNIKKRLLGERDLTCQRAIELAYSLEAAKRDAADMKSSKDDIVNYVKGKGEKKAKEKVTCYCCGRKGHFKSECKVKDSLCDNCGEKSLSVFLTVEGKTVKFEIDTGSPISAMSYNYFVKHREWQALKIDESTRRFKSYQDGVIVPRGTVRAEVKFNDTVAELDLYIIDKGGAPIVGRDWLRKLNMLNVDRENKRLIIGALRDKIEKEIERLVKENIIELVNRSEWATPVVPVIKSNGDIRLCGDFSVTINPCLEVDRHPIPRLSDLSTRLDGGKVFSKLDIAQAYQQVWVDEKSRKSLTLSTHKGLYACNRLMYGVASAPGLFQREMESLLGNIPGVVSYFDEIFVMGKNQDEHDKRLNKVLLKLHERFELSADGIRTSVSKTKAISEKKKPENVSELKSYLGMVSYFSRFIKGFASIVAPLYEMLKKNTEWEWSEVRDKAFEDAKSETMKDVILSQVLDFLREGWPDQVDTKFNAYKLRQLEMTVENDCIMWGHRVVIPESLRQKLLNELHESHWGIGKMKSLARTYMWWPHMDTDIEKLSKDLQLACLQLNYRKVEQAQAVQKRFFRGDGKEEFGKGDCVFSKSFQRNQWEPAIVSERLGPVTYHVKSNVNVESKRYLDQLRPRSNDVRNKIVPQSVPCPVWTDASVKAYEQPRPSQSDVVNEERFETKNVRPMSESRERGMQEAVQMPISDTGLRRSSRTRRAPERLDL